MSSPDHTIHTDLGHTEIGHTDIGRTDIGRQGITIVESLPQRGARRPMLDRGEASSLLAVELDRTLELLRSFDDAAWATPTPDCPGWDVRRMYLHVLGACEAARTSENLRQMRAARRHRAREGGPLEAALSHVQIARRLDLDPGALIDRLAEIAPGTVRRRRKLPGLLRRAAVAVDGPVIEHWTLGYLVDVIYLRDLWMHRVDACRAVGTELTLSPEHDGRIVADVVREWAGRHGQPFTLTLTGPAGGRFGSGHDDAESLELDAVEFCRLLAGRGEPSGLLAVTVPF